MALLELAPVAYLLAVGSALALRWRSLPAHLPVRHTLLGEPDRFVERSAPAVLGPAAAALACVLLLVAIGRRLSPPGSRAGEAIPLARGAAIGCAYAVAALGGALSARFLAAAPGPWAAAVGAGMGFLFLPLFVAAAWSRGEWRRARTNASRAPKASAGAAARRRLLAVMLLGAFAGAALVLARMR